MTVSAPATSVTVERTINAKPEQVYQAFMSRDALNNWFCNNSFVQAQENGVYLCIWNQEQYSATGIFKKLEENKSIEMTWSGTWKDQIGLDPSTITIDIAEAGDGSTITLTHSDLSEGATEDFEKQWNTRLDDLKVYVETGALPNIINRVIIGIWPAAIGGKRAEELGLENGHGTLVTNLVPNFGAEKAGIQIDDVIVAMDGVAVTPLANMGQLVQGKKPGEKVDVTFYRGNEKQTLTMELSGYPVPDIPASMKAHADNVAQQYDEVTKTLAEIFDGVSEEEASKRPAEGEWSAKHVLAHLIYSESWLQETIGGRITGGQPQHWSGNHDTRLQSIMDVYPTTKDLLDLYRREMDETLAIWRNFPADAEAANLNHIWAEAFGIAGGIQHTQGHYAQIKAAIEAAQA